MFDVPSLRALIMLEAATRLGSFRRAAEEIGSTPSAVSHQMSALEATMGVSLFIRTGRGITPSPEAIEFARDVRRSLAIMSASRQRFFQRTRSLPVRIALHPPFAHSWLVPRLDRLAADFPKQDFDLVYVENPSEAFSEGIDLAIDWGMQATAREKEADILVPRQATLVADPAYLAAVGPIGKVSDLSRMRLMENIRTPHEVSQWLGTFGEPRLAIAGQFKFSTSALLLAAIKAGFGAGLACRNLLADDLASGQLVAPFPNFVDNAECYYFVQMPGMRDKRLGKRLREWFLEQSMPRSRRSSSGPTKRP